MTNAAKRDEQEIKAQESNPALMGPPQSVLIIEDDISVIEFLEAVFDQLRPGLTVDYATSVLEAIEKIRSRPHILGDPPYNLVIADIFLEGDETGFEAWAACAREFPQMPFVFTSSLPVEKYVSIVAGFDHTPSYLPKPLTVGRCRSLLLEYV